MPPGYHTITAYVTVPDAGVETEFLRQAFGPQTSETLSQDSDSSIRHAELKIGDSMLMLGQAREDCDAWHKRALAAGAKSLMEPENQFYGDPNAGVEDPAGNYWWIESSWKSYRRRSSSVGRQATFAAQSKQRH